MLELRTTSMENIVSKSSHYTACLRARNEVAMRTSQEVPQSGLATSPPAATPARASHTPDTLLPEGTPHAHASVPLPADPKTLQNFAGHLTFFL